MILEKIAEPLGVGMVCCESELFGVIAELLGYELVSKALLKMGGRASPRIWFWVIGLL